MKNFYNFIVRRHYETSKMSSYKVALQNLRKSMIRAGYDGYILVNSDAHKVLNIVKLL